MTAEYRYSINGISVNPIVPASLSKDWEHENEQRYFRAKLNGKILFCGADYDYLHAQAFNTTFVLTIERYKNGSWSTYYAGKFTKTDSKWDADNKRVEAAITTVDSYTDILAGIDKEFNIIKLNPAIKQLNVSKRPLIQVYSPGDDKVSCFLGGTYFEQDAEEITDVNELTNTYKFALMTSTTEFNVSGVCSISAILSAYTGKTGATYYGNNNTYKATYISYPEEDQYGQLTGNTVYEYRIVRVSDSQEMFKSDGLGSPFGNDVILYPVTGSGVTGELVIFGRTVDFYGRYLLDVDTLNNNETHPIPYSDIVSYNRNYKRCYPYGIDLIVPTARYSTTPTQYGVNDYGTYFLQPYSIANTQYYPVARSKWSNATYWFNFDLADEALEIKGRKNYVLKDCYNLSDVIKVLLQNVAPSISHEATYAYSQFLYSSLNPISSQEFTLMLTQKSNATSGDYDKPAQKAELKLRDIFDMLRDVYHCYWYVENSMLKIEHIFWFMNGGSYTSNATVEVDLTTSLNPKVNKPWSYGENSWSFEKSTLPERIQFNWMDKVTEGFEGNPIDILSVYISKGNIENVQVSKFTTDIDYMLLNPSTITSEGFALFAATRPNKFISYDADNRIGYRLLNTGIIMSYTGYNVTHLIEIEELALYEVNAGDIISWYKSNGDCIYSTPISSGPALYKSPRLATHCRVAVASSEWSSFYFKNRVATLPFVHIGNLLLQNGYLSWLALQPLYHVYDLPAKQALINNISITALGIKKQKKQVVNFPTDDDLNPNMLIKTELGNGQIDKISTNLYSRLNKVTLAYDTE